MDSITSNIERDIARTLDEVEREYDVRVLYACESGSRAWGFASDDSDYDARFLYVNRPNWYLAVDLEEKRDVIELPIEGVLDVNGWDLRKALRLFRKSNPPLMEWLSSPIVYREVGPSAHKLRQLAADFYYPTKCSYHYLRMAQTNYRQYLKGPDVWMKKYFYVLRPLLAVLWIERDLGVVPTEFASLVEALVSDAKLRAAIDELVEKKRSGLETDTGPRIELISRFIDAELARLGKVKFEKLESTGDPQVLNQLFRDVLVDTWRTASH
jgi:predicted nucleotidyltransferase